LCKESHVVLRRPENTTHIILAKKQVTIPPKLKKMLTNKY